MKRDQRHETWVQRMVDFEASGQTIVAWCQEQQIQPSNFYYWRRRLQSSASQTLKQPVKWLSLDLDFKPAAAADLEATDNRNRIKVQIGRATILVEPGFDQDLFRDISRILQGL